MNPIEEIKQKANSLILSQKKTFYAYQITKNILEDMGYPSPSEAPHGVVANINSVVYGRFAFYEETGQIKLVDQQEDGRKKKTYRVVKK